MATEPAAGRYTLVTDANKKQLSTGGDVLKLTATAVSSKKIITAAFKISGGCNCHVQRLDGDAKIVVQ